MGTAVVSSIPGKAQNAVEARRKDAFSQAIINRLAGVPPCASAPGSSFRVMECKRAKQVANDRLEAG